jgi:ketosteroid isomerase-like protein
MSQSDIEALRARYEAVSRGDRAAIYRDVQSGFTLKTPDRLPNAGTYLGGEEATRFVEEFWGPFEEVILEPQEFLESGDAIVVLLLARLRHRGSSAFVEIRVAYLWTMRDGKPIRCEWFPEREKALAAVGLWDQGAHANSP